MKKGKKILNIFVLVGLLFSMALLQSCKREWLEKKPDNSLKIPLTIQDFQELLNNSSTRNSDFGPPFNSDQSAIGEIFSSDFYLSNASWGGLSTVESRAYIYADNIYQDILSVGFWNTPYKVIYNTNIVIEGLEKIIPQNSTEQFAWNHAKGTAFFQRAYNHFLVAQDFCTNYNSSTAAKDIGIPLKTVTDIVAKTSRSSVEDTYNLIISDLKQSLSLLPNIKPEGVALKIAPTKTAANAMLSRVYLAMEKYDSALLYSENALNMYSKLLDYNDLANLNTDIPFPQFNEEVIFHMQLTNQKLFRTNFLIVDSTLYKSFETNDLRKTGFFKGSAVKPTFKGNYTGSILFFSGLAVDELYLIKAECLARTGFTNEALDWLNKLLILRWKKDTYNSITETDPTEALRIILSERRKELCFRGIRFSDLRRLNKDNRFKTTLKRVVNGTVYSLEPNDKRYIPLLIPADVITLTGIPQNPR